MDTYAIVRRNGWPTAEDLAVGAERSLAEGDRMSDDIAWIRSYVLAESDGTVGMICIYQAASPEAIRAHAGAADIPVDEIVKVADTMVVRLDPVPATA
jgi:Nickel responsive protein SCO4226-like